MVGFKIAIRIKRSDGSLKRCRIQVSIQFTEHFNRHIIRIASKDRAILGPLSSLAGCQPRALEVAGSNPAGPIGILDARTKNVVAMIYPRLSEPNLGRKYTVFMILNYHIICSSYLCHRLIVSKRQLK
jgi:hypothetical protein